MKIIKSILRIISLLLMCYTIYLMCFNSVFNAMVTVWMALYFYYVADKIVVNTKLDKAIGDIEMEIYELYEIGDSRLKTEILDTVLNTIDEIYLRYK